MKYLNRPLFAATCLLLVQTSGMAMSLGQTSGSVVFGRPIDLTVQARLDDPQEEPSNCFSAEIFQGDMRLDGNRIRIDVKAGATPLEASVRIRSTSPVTEPWAKVILRTNCGSKISRQYDFLTDFVTDAPANTPNSRLPMVAALAADAQEPATSLKPLVSSPATARKPTPPLAGKTSTSVGKTKAAEQDSASPDAPTQRFANATSPPKSPSLTAPRSDKLQLSDKLAAKIASKSGKATEQSAKALDGKSRLKMEAFDLTDEHQVMLKMSTALLAPTATDTPVNAQALAQAAAVWRALNAKPEDLAVDAQKLQATTAELQSVKDNALKTSTNLQERLRLAESKEFANPLVYGLAGLLALSLAVLTWLYLRLRKASRPDYAWLKPEEPLVVAEDAVFTPTKAVHADEPQMEEFSSTTRLGEYEDDQVSAPKADLPLEIVPQVTEVSELPDTLAAPMVFTIPEPKTVPPSANNPIWPADAASATQTEIPAPRVITPTETFMLPITEEGEAEAKQARAAMRQDIRSAHPDPVFYAGPRANAQSPKPNSLTMADETLDIDLDFSKIAPAQPHDAPQDKVKTAHTKAKKARSTGSLPKSVHQLHVPAVPPLVTDLKSNLIDFESFASPPVSPPASRRH